MAGKLYLCATPIGNLDDVTPRVIETLNMVDLIAAEDTRHTIKLLNHYQIKTPMTSYHEFNKIDKAKYLIREMEVGKNIALVSDAGTPGISDPGEELVRFCHEAGITVTSLPGPAACITALTMSGLSTRRFCFEGFLPTDKKEQQEVLARLQQEERTTIFYEAPHRLLKTLRRIEEYTGNRRIAICKELTKRYEHVWLTSLEEAVDHYEKEEAKGEYVLVLEGADPEVLKKEEQAGWQKMSLKEHMALYEEQGQSRKEAMKSVAKDRGLSKRDVYQMLLKEE